MSSLHSILAPSSAERWLSCPASIRVEAALGGTVQSTSFYAEEGTSAHALGEIEVSAAFNLIPPSQAKLLRSIWRESATAAGFDVDEIAYHIEGYVQFIREQASIYPMSQVRAEQRLDTGVPGCWGTSDVVIVSPKHVGIVDLKYGSGYKVSALGNPQLRLYALGALATYGDVLGDTEIVRATVYQPRMDNVSTEELNTEELLAWRSWVLPIAESALGDRATFGPSDAACRWCHASGQCRAQMEWSTRRDFEVAPDLLSPAELSEALEELPRVKAWAAAVEVAALDRAYDKRQPIPGWKVVLSGGQRSVKDSVAAITRLLSLGFSEEQVSEKKLKGIGDLEKLLKTLPKVGRGYAKLEDGLASS